MTNSTKQALKIVLAFYATISSLSNFVEAKAIQENDISKDNKVSESQHRITFPILSIMAISLCVSLGSIICLKKKSKKDDVDKSKITTVDLSLPYPSTIPRKKDSTTSSEDSQVDISIINQSSIIRLKPIIGERSVSIRRSIIIDKDYSSYCGFSPFPAPGFQFIAIYDYEAQNEDEISLSKNDPLLISTNFEDGWTIGKNCKNDQVGFFPISCLGIGPIEDESNEPTDTELDLFNQMIVPNGKREE
ncbi:hypothetical protein BCR32DRAFT_295375 [Anaeromyces robustus]|uniref:SH3 domain-containing protein n=1 Tax=Anaeromyces robustus TaxID=1754192 RepID=A0A1Y1WWC7_9FUNG|nr:hypothetical protein BCR32DRAFT_295375 [Anaeromyces robustus]|eukprot:ORX77861.1 hypothetical protein BCR32DRAFT_295375 [Anaeromyces robustus]